MPLFSAVWACFVLASHGSRVLISSGARHSGSSNDSLAEFDQVPDRSHSPAFGVSSWKALAVLLLSFDPTSAWHASSFRLAGRGRAAGSIASGVNARRRSVFMRDTEGQPERFQDYAPQGKTDNEQRSVQGEVVLTSGLQPRFAQRILELKAFRERLGHADVPLDSETRSELVPKGLGRWVYAQRKRRAEGTMEQAEEEALVALGFRWKLDPEELGVSEMLDRLGEYKAEFGDTFVPKKYEADPLLGAWVAAMRRKADPLLNGGVPVLDPEIRVRLDEAGFSWEPKKRCGSSFMKGFRIWSEAKIHGLPTPDERWCEAQRKARRQGKLSEQRVSYLDKFAFNWELGEEPR